jgi:hypothetical protein
MRQNKPAPATNNKWYNMDIHIHTPASEDFQQPGVSYLDILQKAESRGIDILAFSDHNTIAGFRALHDEVNQLELLEKLKRIQPDERNKLNEYHRLLNKILLLPGFEFTATFGFHILGLFSPEKSIREIEHLLMNLSIPEDSLDEGKTAIGASVDVLNAYQLINQAGGIVIAAHVNSTNGVAMRGLNFGGQTRIAYTQDANLHALEVTDLDLKGGRTTATFFSGIKPEYPRRMHCIQGSDSHRLVTDPNRKKNPGIGDRTTDVFLPSLSFEALKSLFLSNDFSRTRPHQFKEAEATFDFVQSAHDEGANIIQDFHESASVRGGKMFAILSDICAFANTNGGTLFIGISADPHAAPIGVQSPDQLAKQLEKEVASRISPPIHLSIDQQKYKGKLLLRILVPRGEEPPYALDDNKIYIRDEEETNLAVRDEIVNLVSRRLHSLPVTQQAAPARVNPPNGQANPSMQPALSEIESNTDPRTGVEVVTTVIRNGKSFYTLRDLRNGSTVKNVTTASARRLWHYALTKYNEITPAIEKENINWQGDYGLLRQYSQGKFTHYDLIQRTTAGYRYFFGVTIDGIHGPWKAFLPEEESA